MKHEELKNEKMTLTSEVDEYIIQLNNEMKGTFVKKKIKIYIKNIKKIKILEDYVLMLLIEHNYQFLGTDGGGRHHRFCSSMRQARL